MDEPSERSPSDKSLPPGAVSARDRSGWQVGLLWVAVFAAVALAVALVAWLLA